MTKRQALHLLGLSAGPLGYGSFIGLSLAGVALAPLALAPLPVGLALAMATSDR